MTQREEIIEILETWNDYILGGDINEDIADAILTLPPEITDEDIELYARENSLNKTTEDGIIKGAKAHRDGEIKHIEG
jgi:hypothetical protein